MNRSISRGPVLLAGQLRPAILLAGLIAIFLSTPSRGRDRGQSYPKLLVYSSAIGHLPDATQDSLSWYDVLVCSDRPEVVASLRARNADLRLLWSLSPQFATPPDSAATPWWLPDTLWSPSRLIQHYAQKNDWYLRDTSGRPITDGSSFVLNWTRYCPPGVFGSSRGLRAAEWIARVALPGVAFSRQTQESWSWDSRSAYNGFIFEILADCLGSYGWEIYAQADPNRDGVADGVYSACSATGADDPLSVLMREENDLFYRDLDAAFPTDFVFLSNENNRYIGPAWCTRLSGMKLENWMRPSNPSWMDWWDWFYGLTPPWDPGENWGVGYAWTEAVYDRQTADSLKGWDLSFIQVWAEQDRSDEENLRQMRLGLGTAMLGDGYFAFTRDQRYPLWQREFDWDFGPPLGPFARELPSRGDSLYVRFFRRGMVEVNPNDSVESGVPARDSRFTFWLPVQDLAAEITPGRNARVTWTTPAGEENDADFYELRYAMAPITLDTWDSAMPYAGNPVVATPGSPVSVTILGLRPGAEYHFAVRAHTRGRPEPTLSNEAWVRSPSVQNDLHPSTPPRTDPDPVPTDETGSNGSSSLPSRSGILAIDPNPSAGEATIRFAISPGTGPVRITIEDVAGRRVRTLVEGAARAGSFSRTWDGFDDRGKRAAPGIYFVRLSWCGGVDGRKLMLVR